MRAFLTFVLGLLVGAAAIAWIDRHGGLPATHEPVASTRLSGIPAVPPDVRMESEMDAAAWPPPVDSKPIAGSPAVAAPGNAPAPVLGMDGVNPAGPPSSAPAAPLPGSESAGGAAPTAGLPLPPSQPLLLPVGGVQAAQLVDTYTQSRGEGRSHDAIDIMAPRGTPVYAVEDGHVAKLFLSKPGGITLYEFDPSERVAYYYAHLEGYADGMVEGKQLKRGELIGYVGSTGNASPTAPHLHFAIFGLGPEKKWWQGTAINPYPLLGGRPH
jgi:murein DD-endopeptidase MepM/ murein hydrolase activator NlpD